MPMMVTKEEIDAGWKVLVDTNQCPALCFDSRRDQGHYCFIEEKRGGACRCRDIAERILVAAHIHKPKTAA